MVTTAEGSRTHADISCGLFSTQHSRLKLAQTLFLCPFFFLLLCTFISFLFLFTTCTSPDVNLFLAFLEDREREREIYKRIEKRKRGLYCPARCTVSQGSILPSRDGVQSLWLMQYNGKGPHRTHPEQSVIKRLGSLVYPVRLSSLFHSIPISILHPLFSSSFFQSFCHFILNLYIVFS